MSFLQEQEKNPYGTVLQGPQMFDFLLNASLDMVEQLQWNPSANKNQQQAQMYMKRIDRYGDLNISCMMTPSNTKFLLLHESIKQEDQIQMFFNEVYELYVKIIMSPFYDGTQQINIPMFDDRVKKIGMRCFS